MSRRHLLHGRGPIMATLILMVVCACATVNDTSTYDLGSDSTVVDTAGDTGLDTVVDDTGLETDCTGSGVEVCNGLDDDCDTIADEDFDCVMGESIECVTTCGTYGSGTCDLSCNLPTGDRCTPPAEECNGIDDDCDGETDEDWPPGTCGTCTPDCTGRECGPDPLCGTSCGTCTTPETCNAVGECVCIADCGTRECGPDPVCGLSCGTCTAPETCDAWGMCACVPDCTGRECGPDPACGESCGTCTSPETCDASGHCASTCVPDCTGRECGPDPVCEESCGTCTAPATCNASGVCETPCALYFYTDFSDTCTPSGWSVSDWRCQNFNNYTGGSGMYRTANSFTEVVDATMLTDWYDASGCTTVYLDFAHRYNDYSGSTDAAYVDITFDGTDWTNVITYTADDDLHQHLDLHRSTWGAETDFRIRFRYVGDYDGCWDVDNVEISGT